VFSNKSVAIRHRHERKSVKKSIVTHLEDETGSKSHGSE